MTNDNDVAALVRHELVASAATLAADARDKLAAARTALRSAEQAAAVARLASETVSGDPLTLAAAERDTADALIFAGRIVGICERRVAETAAAQMAAWGAAHQPIHDQGATIRLAAVRRADAARAELVAAEADFQRGTALVIHARGAGCTAAAHLDGGKYSTSVTNESAERALWGA